MKQQKILFYVQHLLGVGHLVRAGRIAAVLAQGAEVLLVVGGELPHGLVPSGIAMLHLPPVRAAEGGFSSLVHPDGTPFSEADKARRRDRLIEAFDLFRPDVLLIEAFPFGRRAMRFELLPLLERAERTVPRPLVACSLRDILQPARPERQLETLDLVRRHFDLVLVHGAPDLFPLKASFAPATEFEDRIRYTGMVGPDLSAAAETSTRETFDVIVSVGGGAVGTDLLRAAFAARRGTALADARWLVLTGPNMRGDIVLPSTDGVTIRTFAAELPVLLKRAKVSVSQAGYNTVADLAAARCRAVLVPFARGGETEQSRRAALLHDRGWAVALPEAQLNAENLAAAIDRALDLPQEAGIGLALGGAEGTRTIIEREITARRSG